MSKLVDDPIDSEPFLPLLMPALERAADAMSDPEARSIAENGNSLYHRHTNFFTYHLSILSAAAQLQRLNQLVIETKSNGSATRHANKEQVLAALNSKVGPAITGNAANNIPLSHIAGLCCSLMNLAR